MYLIAIAWLYVVLMMAVAEALSPQGTVLGAFFTLLLFGIFPLSIVLYIVGTPGRRRWRKLQEAQAAQNDANTAADRPAGAAADGPAAAPDATPSMAASDTPDGHGVASGDAAAPVGKKV